MSALVATAEQSSFTESFSISDQLGVLSDIYHEDKNIVIWQREFSDSLKQAAEDIVNNNPKLQISATVTPQNAHSIINHELGLVEFGSIVSDDIAQLVDMFCCLFDSKNVGLRLTSLNKAMCPRFHVDRVPCRLVTTYFGVATQWLDHNSVDRSKLGPANQGKPDELSGLFQNQSDIQQLAQAHVALLKGELWERNEGRGLVHRSPQLANNAHRLLLTLDLI